MFNPMHIHPLKQKLDQSVIEEVFSHLETIAHKDELVRSLCCSVKTLGWTVKSLTALDESELAALKSDTELLQNGALLGIIHDPLKGEGLLKEMHLCGFLLTRTKTLVLNPAKEAGVMLSTIIHEAAHIVNGASDYSQDHDLDRFYDKFYAFLTEKIYNRASCSKEALIALAKSVSAEYQVPWEKVEADKARWLYPDVEPLIQWMPKERGLRYLREHCPEILSTPRRVTRLMLSSAHSERVNTLLGSGLSSKSKAIRNVTISKRRRKSGHP